MIYSIMVQQISAWAPLDVEVSMEGLMCIGKNALPNSVRIPPYQPPVLEAANSRCRPLDLVLRTL